MGKKWINIQKKDAGDWHDDYGWGDGWDPDVLRSMGQQPKPDNNLNGNGNGNGNEMGSTHPVGFQGLIGDGSV